MESTKEIQTRDTHTKDRQAYYSMEYTKRDTEQKSPPIGIHQKDMS